MTSNAYFDVKVHLYPLPGMDIDETMKEVKWLVNHMKESVPEVPPIDVIIHFPPDDSDTDDLPF